MRKEEYIRNRREQAYRERIGKIYNDFKVVGIEWDAEKKRQVWEVECIYCGVKRTTTAWHSYVSGKVGQCKKCGGKTNKAAGTNFNGWWKIIRYWKDGDKPCAECQCRGCGERETGDLREFVMKTCKCGYDPRKYH